ncbi:DNA-binding transcriptional regulator, AcrR family [Micromonospora phaseoli]|uniref:DNA-binding transcriptional regulator, AcrR family n=1 Tax=Micromonospora phaseoli TaxID=1144548 RepID=A0A1H6SPD7_9ACTN|nr:TetR family transcriptional regulator [Micromonospora phaseoli]PZW04047.1 TetR family transcriptional regulator [Micromonospora phaseoli]GIJ81385.1 TetR family transcriptional regulator [Micromonospora phaseoli]SEI69681.1 DNA-binding transcriptional regulator, AcrR family [Micromonospora phaseoli]
MTRDDPTPLGRRDRKKRQTRAALATAALRLVAERGLDQVTVEEISEAADVSARTFFNYFPTKDDALVGDPEADRDRALRALAAVPPEQPALEALRRAFTEVVDEVQGDAELWLLRMRVVVQHPVLLARLVSGNAVTEQALVSAVAARTGLPPDDAYPALVVAVAGAALRTSMIRWATCDGAGSLAALLDEAFAAVAAGLPDPRTS